MKFKRAEELFKQREENSESGGHHSPMTFRMRFVIFLICRCCKSVFFTRLVSLYDGNIVCNYPKCGARHLLTPEEVTTFQKFRPFILVLLAVLLLTILLALIL